jgi:CheY-like chemotaxis protein
MKADTNNERTGHTLGAGAADDDPSAEARQPTSRTRPILVVDDDPAISGLFVDLLTEQGYRVESLADGSEVLPRLEARDYGMVLLDMLLPHVSGFAIIEQIRASRALQTLPVVAMSGIYPSRNHRASLVERFRLVDYLDKPIATARLLQLAQQCLPLPTRRADPAHSDTPTRSLTEDTPSPAGCPPPQISDRLDEEDWLDAEALQEGRQVELASRSNFKPSAFVLQGSIAETPVARVLGRLWYERASGALLLRRDAAKKIIYVRGGNAYAVKTNLVSECLGRLLVREQLITAAQCEQSVRHLRDDPGARQGEVLVRMGSLNDKQLHTALGLQLQTKLFGPFSWRAGEYRFNSSLSLPGAPELALPWQGPAIVVEGIRRSFDETRLRERMVPVLQVPVDYRPDERVQDLSGLGLTVHEVHALRSVIFPSTTGELVERLPLPPVDALRVLYSLIALELLTPAASG